MSELERIISKYLSKESDAITYSDFNQDEVNKLFQNMEIYERPDILSIFDDKIIGIEHFEFDSFKRNRKGSDFKVKENQVKKKREKER